MMTDNNTDIDLHEMEHHHGTLGKERSCDLMEFCSPPWDQHFQDVLDCRFDQCIQRVQTATNDQIQDMKNVSLLSTAIHSSFHHNRAKRVSQEQEQELVDYTKALLARGVEPNDSYLPPFFLGPENRTAVGTAAYYGYNRLLEFLLVQAKCSIKAIASSSGYHALEYAVSNRQHASMKILFDHCAKELCQLLHQESTQGNTRDYRLTTLGVAINNADVVAIQMLHERGHAMLRTSGTYTQVKFRQALQELHPTATGQSLNSWSRELHWTFPITDRLMINWIWNYWRPSYPDSVCDDVWLKILSFVGREWWYDTIQLPS